MTSYYYSTTSASGNQSESTVWPPAPIGSFRLFRIISLYPVINIELQTFAHPDAASTEAGIGLNPRAYHGSSSMTDACPLYDAISYAWKSSPSYQWSVPTGSEYNQLDSGSTQPVVVHVVFKPSPAMPTINPVTIHITNHLLHGLLAIQETQAPKWLFADTICVDQSNPEDKAIQVNGMDRVFRGARKVFIWLGMDMGVDWSELARGKGNVSDFWYTPDEHLDEANMTPTSTFYMKMTKGTCLEHIPALVRGLDAYLEKVKRGQDHASSNGADEQDGMQKECDRFPAAASLEGYSESSESQTLQSLADVLLTTTPSTLWSALHSLRFNSWFHRLWTVQEVTLARNPILVYGHHALAWSIYAKLTAMCQKIVSRTSVDEHDPKLVRRLRLANNDRVLLIEQLRKHYLLTWTSEVGKREAHHHVAARLLPCVDPCDQTHIHTDLERDNRGPDMDKHVQSRLVSSILSVIRKSTTSLPIDRVYGIIGLLPTHMRECIPIDYTTPTQAQHVTKWIEFFQVILFFTPDIAEELFSHTCARSEGPVSLELPSWCLDLSKPEEVYALTQDVDGISNWAGMPGGQRWIWSHRTDENEIRTVVVIPNTLTIRLLGLQAEEIEHVIDLSWIEAVLNWNLILKDSRNISSEVARDILASLWKCLELIHETGVTLPMADTALARCLTAGGYDLSKTDIDSSPSIDDVYRCLITNKAVIRLTNEYICFTQYLEHHTWGSVSGGALRPGSEISALRFGDRFQKLARGRAFCVTKTGKLGLCSSQAREGDRICVFMNYRMPYLLRERDRHESHNNNDSTFQLLGEAYLDGIMHGEAFLEADRDMVEEQPDTFVIS